MKEQTVFSCDYNGWADVPEDEREALDAFETTSAAPVITVYGPLVLRPLRVPVHSSPERRAA
jgi:hypothetical protein